MEDTQGSTAAVPSLPPNLTPSIVDRLVSIHAKLLQLVEAISEFQRQIQYGGAEGMIGWQDILSKYSLLTSYTHSVFDLLVTPPSLGKAAEAHKAALGVEKPRYKTREEQRVLNQLDQEAWKKTLAQSVVHPGRTVEQDRDFVIQVLLRTKQIPEVEAEETSLLASIPSLDNPVALYTSLKAHDELADKALESCKRLRESVEDREFNWKARIEGDDDEEDEDEDNKKGNDHETEVHKEPKYSLGDLARYMRDGILPR